MRTRSFAAGVLLGSFVLASAVGCRDRRSEGTSRESASSTATAAHGGAAAVVQSAQAMASALAGLADTKVTGKVHSEGGELGTWDIDLVDCQSGEYNGFYGVDFYVEGDKHLRLRYVHDEAAGDIVKLAIPSEPGVAKELDRSDKCAVLEGSVQKMTISTRVAGRGYITHLQGHVKFDCKYNHGPNDKGHVTGESTFTNCH